MPLHVFQLTADALNEQERAVNGSKIAVLGLSYKENVGDPRESPSKVVVEELKKRGAQVHLVDPYVDEQTLRALAIPEATVYDLSLIHISEPTRLLSISYAVLCLKK